MATCQSCANWTPKANPTWARLGFAPCQLGSRHNFKSAFKPKCDKYQPASVDVQEDRKEWLNKWLHHTSES